MLFVVLLISTFFHFLLISKGPVSTDCLDLAIKAQAAYQTHQFQFLFGTGYPLMVILGYIFIAAAAIFGIHDPVMAVNCIGVVFSSVAVAALYALTARVCGRTTGVIAAILLLLNPIFVDISSYGINHAPALFFILFGLLKVEHFQRTRISGDLMLGAFSFGLLSAARLQDFILILPALAAALLLGISPGVKRPFLNRRIALYAAGVVLLTGTLLHAPFVKNSLNYHAELNRFIDIGVTQNFRGIFSDSLLTGLSFLGKAFTIVAIAWYAAGVYYLRQAHMPLLVITALWILIPFLFYSNVWSVAPRFFVLLLPAVIIPVSLALTRCLAMAGVLPRVVAAVSLIIIACYPLYECRDLFLRRHASSPMADFYTWIGKTTEHSAVIITADDGLFVTYYAGRQRMERPRSEERLPQQELARFQQEVDLLLNNNTPVYITHLGLSTYDHYHDFSKLMEQHYRLSALGSMPLELWYQTPFNPMRHTAQLFKIETK